MANMKIKYVIFSLIIVIFFSITIDGQTSSNVKAKTNIKQKDVSSVLGKPVYESTVDSLNTKVWIITQKKYIELISSKKGKLISNMNNNIVRDKANKKSIMTGTHYFIFDVMNIINGKEIANTGAKVEIVSPSRKVSSVQLQPMMNHFGGSVILDEKGEYLFTINLNIGWSYATSQFKFKIK
jgi:hypothetical protein